MIESFVFGHLDGEVVRGFVLRNRNGLSAKLITYGARLTELHAPDRTGEMADIVLGFDDVASYVATDTYFGATCGRYGNRIRDGRFSLDGEAFQLSLNEGANHLHGGIAGFDRKNWDAAVDEATNTVTFSAVSPHGEEGYPGTVNLSASYRLTDDNRLEIAIRGMTDRPTILNAVHHTYWNLAGHGSGDVRDQVLVLNSDFYTPIDAELLTTGEVLAVAGTPFDFSNPKPIGADIDALADVGTGHLVGGGYDHNWCLKGDGEALRLCARVVDPASGRGLELHTTEPGVQFYTGGYLNETVIGKSNTPYCRFAGYTFETQKFPDTPNFAHFPSTTVSPGEVYDHRMSVRFFTE
ncbi:aldose 1-epimerase [Kaistia sp. 32K]|uniref:aldose epimerase family protein n=1 Tax=Kaistia sp. 32K TaxID=2795690 RepID=UPI001915F74B|nr:aldose epimerase family protein [Kaistia sp. 32K]BCP52131.1 aldose 1-epimerase [Kaistia sp. 32K]